MSDNSIIYLNLKDFTVTHADVEMEIGYAYKIKKCKDLKTAIKEAKKIQDEENPEYGVYIL